LGLVRGCDGAPERKPGDLQWPYYGHLSSHPQFCDDSNWIAHPRPDAAGRLGSHSESSTAMQRLIEKFPWPAERPDCGAIPEAVRGWLEDGPRQMLAGELSPETHLVIEIGSWLGMSARYIADLAPNALVIAIDHWKGSPEHQQKPEWRAMLPRLYEAFLAECWDYRHRMIPVRLSSLAGLQAVADAGAEPDVIYIDGEHSYEAVTAEVELALVLFPRAVLMGDDYSWPGIAAAVQDAARRHRLGVETVGSRWKAWKLVAGPLAGPPVPSPTALAPAMAAVAAPAVVDCERVRAERSQPRCVTYFDPSWETGLGMFMAIAEGLGRLRPDIPILVVERELAAAHRQEESAADLLRLRNVKRIRVGEDRRGPWSETRVALIPWTGWDRPPTEAIEALINGVAVVASDRGALPAALGKAGRVLRVPGRFTPATPWIASEAEAAPWVEAIARLYDRPGDIEEQRRLAMAEVDRRSQLVGGRRGVRLPEPATACPAESVVLVPYLHAIEPDCEASLRELERTGVRVVRFGGSSQIDVARDSLASDALHDGTRSLLFIDADIRFDPRDALRLLARPEPILAGIYVKKNRRALTCEFADGITEVVFGDGAPAGFYPLKFAPGGFLRIRAEALRLIIDALRLPLCNTRWGRGVWPFFQPMIIPLGQGQYHYLGEDWAFSQRLHQVGLAPLADTSIRLWHLGAYRFGWEDAGDDPRRFPTYRYRIEETPG
jgi:hypothetical protein